MERVPLIRRHLQLHARTMRGRVGSVGWIPPEDLSEDEWADVGILLARIDASTRWWVGDWWNHGIKNYGARKTMVESQAWQGPSFQTCANAASVCRAFETYRRREVLTFGHHAEVSALDPKEADRLLDWAQATLSSTGKSRSIKDLRREVRRHARLGPVSSSARTVPAELGTGSDEKAKHHHSLAKLKEELASKDAYIAELEVAREQQLSAKPSAAQDIQTASVRQLIDALVALAKQKTDDEIMQMVDQVCGRLNRLKRKDVEAGAVQDARPGVARR
jgi:hypothetical protein